jgi:hypothetical protein
VGIFSKRQESASVGDKKDRDLRRLQNAIKVERMYSRGRDDRMERSANDLLSQAAGMVRAGRTAEAIDAVRAAKGPSSADGGDAGDSRWNRVADVAIDRLESTPPEDPQLRVFHDALQAGWGEVYLTLWCLPNPDSRLEVITNAIGGLARGLAHSGKTDSARSLVQAARRESLSLDHDAWNNILASVEDQL